MCGILGISCGECHRNNREAFQNLMTCGNDICHRGEQAWGVLTSNKGKMALHQQEGRFSEGVTENIASSLAKKLQGDVGIVHTLYSTVGKAGQKWQPKNIQPMTAKFHGKPFGLSYNGNIYDYSELKKETGKAGWKFQSETSDTE